MFSCSTTHSQKSHYLTLLFRGKNSRKYIWVGACVSRVYMIMSWRIYSLVYAFNYVLINFERCSVVPQFLSTFFYYFLLQQQKKRKNNKSRLEKICSLTAGANNFFYIFSLNRFSARKKNKYRWMTLFVFLFQLHRHEKRKEGKKEKSRSIFSPFFFLIRYLATRCMTFSFLLSFYWVFIMELRRYPAEWETIIIN